MLQIGGNAMEMCMEWSVYKLAHFPKT